VSLDTKQIPSESEAERRPLRIAQIATLWESVPPRGYGGTERNVSYLTEELVRRGHQVTLFASGDSVTSAKLFPGCERSLRLTNLATIGVAIHHRMLSQAYERASQFDIIHAHLDYWSFPFARLVGTPSLTTMHGRLDIPELHFIYRNYSDTPLVSVSDAQRIPLPEMNWVATIHHGLNRDLLKFNPEGGKYLAFLGRISPEKGIEAAIEVARKAGIPLKIAAKVDDFDREYYQNVMMPLLAQPGVEYLGEINDSRKSDFLGNAIAVLFPIEWPEPFGMVMIESMACGTPIIARPLGAVSEVLRDGVTGFIAPDVDGMVAAVKKVASLSRRRCREEFENRFTIDAETDQYETIYRGEIAKGKARGSRRQPRCARTEPRREERRRSSKGLVEAPEFL
jgi:glycosyltransferase involved in cell wall biosynthesis